MEANSSAAAPHREGIPVNGEQEQGGTSPMVYVFKLLYFWPYLLVALVMGLAAAFIYNRYAQPVYNINASLLIREDKGASSMKNLDAMLMGGGFGGATSTTDNEMGIIQSYALVDQTLKELDFGVEVTRLGQFSREEVYPHQVLVLEVDSFHPQLVEMAIEIEVLGKGRYRITENGKEGSLYDPLRFSKIQEDLGSEEDEPVASDIRTGTYAFGQWLEGHHHRFRVLAGANEAGSGNRYSVQFHSHKTLLDQYFGK